ncbi:MAG: DUF1549 domain-containing protein, partial [Armatimonadetes bacterium]|nr:DUF1549 domain-containing protein [Armatimonadota bacterium]
MKISSWILGLSTSVLGFAMLPETLRQSPGKKVSYDRDIRPILSEHCFKCHGPDVDKAAAGLRLDSFAGATAKVVVPGHPKTSVLIARVSEKDPEDRMPPKDSGVKALTAEQIETLKKWIEQGGQYEKHWSFVTPEMPAIPKVKDASWVRNPVDNFVLSRMETAGIKPESGADKNTLALRASQSLTGLPPSSSELALFVNDNKPLAFERYVDRLMVKPEYGEHQARYWLDAVRYGDTHGLQLDNERAIYPYRDWVVRAFNSDLPYDKFVLWQLAGDLLPNPTTEQLIATGYVRMNLTTNEGGAIPEEFLTRNTFDRVDTTSTALLGLTVACAKCHDHKYDPIKQADYYGLYAFFNSTEDEPLDGNIALPPPVIQAPLPEQEKALIKMESRLSTLRGTVDPRTAAKWFRENHRLPEIAQKWELSPVYISSSFDKAFDEAQPGEPGQAEAKWNPLAFEIGQDVPGIIKKDSAFMYIRGKLQPKSSQKLAVRILSDDAVKVWLNGKLIHSNKTSRGLKDGSDLVQLELKAGENELIAKVV